MTTGNPVIREQNITPFLYGLCHVLARSLTTHDRKLVLCMSWGKSKSGVSLPDHAFAMSPTTGIACDARGWFPDGASLLRNEYGEPLDHWGDLMTWSTGHEASRMIEEAMEDGRLRRPTINEAIDATLLSRQILAERPTD